jgi:hypothetical protein
MPLRRTLKELDVEAVRQDMHGFPSLAMLDSAAEVNYIATL